MNLVQRTDSKPQVTMDAVTQGNTVRNARNSEKGSPRQTSAERVGGAYDDAGR